MKRIKKIPILLVMLVAILSLGCLNLRMVFAATNTDSEYVNTVSDLKTTKLDGGVTLYEQKMSSLLNGQAGKNWQEHFVQWVDLANYDNGVKVVTWTNQSEDKWTATTTRNCAIDWEEHHPGWIVVAAVNGDFFQNSGTITYEPTNNFMADGDMYRADYVGNYRKVIGFTDDNQVVVGDPKISGLYLELMSEDGKVNEQFPIATYNATPNANGLNLYTKDTLRDFDLTGYTVYVGKYTICRVSNGNNKTVFVKGAIESSRPGTDSEWPRAAGVKETVKTREFYIATKDAQYASKLTNGTLVRCQHNYIDEWSDVTQSIGFIYQMLVNNKAQFRADTETDFLYTDHPRTFIGFKADQTPVLMVVDGRGKVG